ncbi:hypothetical protein METBIDRAFT_42982 [Metschnikowia bicuspidata var. bicuspidata NRRL YB-4993]|uniref:L domain-like protein n=1 Tax=Metschnikowia bicuspidata var. bicuspidata NRRL YB-4993 TaxID=869754 RepID=A0A1A0H8H8_9ASCO|nr:hypothetical protein METBIDRAFT_42982 [Metschnikowia bicuspidata var. bicuspidata NRRL YB-4993]OBA20188.1 hypothetical protein METBIDRAFT_42982 [Metschnikowia bicuspidata var. bicuspidata NRRL YB-4993]
MEKNSGLLPFAYSSLNERSSLNTAPREKHVIDENARSMYHTRISGPAGPAPQSSHRVKGPTLLLVPSIKRKMGESFYENDDKKRQDTNEEMAIAHQGKLLLSDLSAIRSASITAVDSDQSTDATEPDLSDNIIVASETHNLPSSPPPSIHASEYDVSIHDYPVPESPVNRRRRISLNTSPVKGASRVLHQSSEPDFGIDAFNRFKVSFQGQCPSTDTDVNVEIGADSTGDPYLFLAARDIILQSFENVLPCVNLDGMQLTEIPDEIKDLNNLVIFNNGPSRVLRQLFLTNNLIKVLNPSLFKFTKLNVLSLRRNQIRYLPNSIGKLQDLTDLNISMNNLRYLPPQILNLPNLSTLGAGPNPYLEIPEDAIEVPSLLTQQNKVMRWVSPIRILQTQRNTASLKAICLDTVGKYDVSYSETKRWKKTIPRHLQSLVALAISKAKFLDCCENCDMIAVEPYAEVIEWWDILQNVNVPIKRKFCSGLCLQKYQMHNQYAVMKKSESDGFAVNY